MLSELDPTELAVGNARMAYAAYMLSGLTGQQMDGVPASEVDLALVQQLVEQYAPEAFAAADAWLSTTDTSMLLPGRTVRDECYYAPYQCPLDVRCEFAVRCTISDCGQAADCSTCPDLFGLPHLAFDRWCAYTCLSNAGISGWGILFHVTLLDRWWLYCHGRH